MRLRGPGSADRPQLSKQAAPLSPGNPVLSSLPLLAEEVVCAGDLMFWRSAELRLSMVESSVMAGQYEMWPSYSYYDPHQPWQPWGAPTPLNTTTTTPHHPQTQERQSWPADLDIFFSNNQGSLAGQLAGQPLEVLVSTPSPVQEVPSLPSPLTESESGYSSYSSSQASGDAYEEYRQSSYPGQVSPPSSPDLLTSDTKPVLPPINLKNNISFTEAELKAITPWRNALIERLLANQARGQTTPAPQFNKQETSMSAMPAMPAMPAMRTMPAPNQNLFQQERPAQTSGRAQGRPRQGRQGRSGGHLGGGGGALFHDINHLTELSFGESEDYHGVVRRGTTAFTAISGCIQQANQGTGTVRAVVETILKFCLPRSLSHYSLTGKSLQEKMEVRNGQTQSRVVMSESGSSKLCIPPQLITGLATFLKLSLTPEGLAASGSSSVSSFTRKLISKSCSRSQEKRNLEMKKR